MKQSQYNSYDDLPLFLNADIVAKVLGVSSSTSYELMHEPDFPVLNVGSRMVVPKEAFIQWVTKHTEGGVREWLRSPTRKTRERIGSRCPTKFGG